MTSTSVLRIGTRASQLARTQTGYVIDALGVNAEIVAITTEGDVSPLALSQIGGTGVFVTALRTALLNGEIDMPSTPQDLPTAPADGITIAAIRSAGPARCSHRANGLTLDELPNGAYRHQFASSCRADPPLVWAMRSSPFAATSIPDSSCY